MSKNPLAETIRAKKLGVLIRDARLSAGKNSAECAHAIRVDQGRFEAYEMGEDSPSLPEIELLALFLNVPLEHFWGNTTLSTKDQPGIKFNPDQLIKLRQKMIGALIKQARMQAGLSVEELSEKAEISSPALGQFELGEAGVPIPVLETILNVLNRSLKEFQDQRGPVGTWNTQQNAVKGFLELSPELQAFVSKPINRPYLELAQRLSEMSVEKLRAVAEGLLEITL